MAKTDRKQILINIDLSWSFGLDFLRGFIRYSQLYTNWNLIRSLPFYVRKQTPFTKAAKEADCIVTPIINRSMIDNKMLIEKHFIVFPTGIEPVENAINICTDDNAIGKMAAEYFLQKGYRNFAFFGYPLMKWSNNRGMSFINFVSDAKFETSCFNIKKTVTDSYSESKYVSDWLESLPKPVAIFCCNDDRTRDLIEVAAELNLRVPDDVALLGVDNNESICNLATPTLSTVELNTQNTGYNTAKLLEDSFNKQDHSFNTAWVNPTRIISRESTDHIAVNDQALIKAMLYIKSNAREMIQACDVADHVGLSRRHLDLKFIDKLGIPLSKQIKNIKINIICEMLLKTHENIADISKKVGFQETDHFSRFFRSQTGISPSQYRTKNR